MSKKEFKIPAGRLQSVHCDSTYNKKITYKVEDFFNQKPAKNPRLIKIIEDSIQGQKDKPYHQFDYKNFGRIDEQKKYNKDDIFETNKKKNKKKNNKSKNKTPIKQYKNEFHQFN